MHITNLKLFFAAGVSAPLLALAIHTVLKVWGPSPNNKYDQPGETATCQDSCLFCRFIQGQIEPVFEDDEVFVFHDHYPKASTHLLVVPKRHIKNSFHLRKSDWPLLEKMKNAGLRVLGEFHSGPSKYCLYRIGFHHPVFTSVPHLHLHVMGLPYRNKVNL